MAQRFGSPIPYDAEENQRRKRRRYLSRSDEEILDEMDKRGLTYRAGWPTLPPMPIETIHDGAFAAVPGAYTRIQEADSILEAQGIYNRTIYFAFRVPRDASETDDLSQYLTLLCIVDMQKHSYQVIGAIVRIRSAFKRYESTDNVQIECVDYRAKESLGTFPISNDGSRIRERWEETVAPIVQELLKPHEWLCLQMLRRGLGNIPEECPPTIVITTPTAGDSKWPETIIPKISAAIANVASDFQVEVLCGTSFLAGRKKYRPSNVVDSKAYQKTVCMGSSMGISDDDERCATVGGSVTLEGGIRCGITNWHCVRDDRLDKVVSKTDNGALTIGNKTLMNAPQHILSPSTYDHHGYLSSLQQTIQTHKDAAARGVDRSRAIQEKYEEEYRNTQQASRSLGHVYAGSGRRTITANKYATDAKTGKSKEKKKSMETEYLFPLDWALVRMENVEQRNVINWLPDVPPPRSSLLGTAAPCEQWSTFRVDKGTVRTAKYGRTSAWTLGTINSCMARISPKTDAQISEAHGFTLQNPGWCFDVVNDIVLQDFVEPGDSGSILVHDGSGTQLGLIFGVTSAGTGMFLPIDLVFQDIQRVTGKKVVDPAYVAPEVVGLADYQLVE